MSSENANGKIITFYSYKGGTGRSMALANVAWVLASNGRRVLAVDWDLEAPGLHRYFYPFLVDRELTSSDGVIDLLIDFEIEALTLPEEGRIPDKEWYKPHADILRYAASLEWEFPGGGTLDFIPAGRQADSYSTRVTTFNWQNFYDRLGGGVFLEAVKSRMREEYDYILIDSRTGVSDASGICTIQMPDALAVCFTLNHQSIEGAAAVAKSVYEQRRSADRELQVFPIPMRIENAEKDKLELRREYSKKHFESFPAHLTYEKRLDYWGDVEVIYIPYYAYEEILAPFGDKRGQTVSLLASVERLTAYLTQGDTKGEVTRLVTPPEHERQRVLAQYARQFLEDDDDEEQFKADDDAQIELADNVFASLTPEQQTIARDVFTRLVRVSPPGELGVNARLKVKSSELGEKSKPVVDQLLYQQLILLGIDPETEAETVELVHDSMAGKWKRLQHWIAEDRDFLLWRQGLQPAIAKWEGTGRNEDALLHGAFLEDAERYWAKRRGDLSDHESTFIAESVVAEIARHKTDERLRQNEKQARLETVKVRKEKRRFVLVVSAAALVLFAAFYQLMFHRNRTLTYLGLRVPEFAGEWKDNFLFLSDGKPQKSLWNYPPEWRIQKGEGGASDDGALLVKGNALGVLNIQPRVLFDFKAEFKVRIKQGSKAAWVFRAQPDKQRGYVFTLERDDSNKSLMLQGYVVTTPGKLEPLDQLGGHYIPFRGCCKTDDAFHLRVEVKGNEFSYRVTVEPPVVIKDNQVISEESRIDTGVEYFIEPFKDSRSTYSYGDFGLFEPQPGSEIIFEYVRIWSDGSL